MTVSKGCTSETYVNISKLTYQLLNGKVILERLPQHLVFQLFIAKHINPEIENTDNIDAGFKGDENEAEADFEQDAIDAESKDDNNAETQSDLHVPVTDRYSTDNDDTESNNVQAVADDENAYRVIRKEDDGAWKKYCMANCDVCNETFTGNLVSSKCPKCSQTCHNLKCGKCQEKFSRDSSLKHHLIYKCMPRHTQQFTNFKRAAGHIQNCKMKPYFQIDTESNENVKSNNDQVVIDDKQSEYSVIQTNDDCTRKNYLTACCFTCKVTSTVTSSITKCPKCNNSYEVFQCGKCLSQYSLFKSLMGHLYYKCMPLKTFICQKCNYQCHLLCQIKDHVKTHKRSTICYKCQKQFSNRKRANDHMKWCGNKHTFRCDFCDFQCIKKSYLLYHMNLKHLNENDMSADDPEVTYDEDVDYHVVRADNFATRKEYVTAHCYVCNETFSANLALSKCPKCQKNYKMFQCGKCQIQYSSLKSLMQHLIYKCEPNVTYICKKCDYSCHKKCIILAHLKSYSKQSGYHNLKQQFDDNRHTVTPLPNYNNKLTCPKCDKQFSAFAGLFSHKRFCKVERSVECQLCEFKTYNSKTLFQHMKAKHTINDQD